MFNLNSLLDRIQNHWRQTNLRSNHCQCSKKSAIFRHRFPHFQVSVFLTWLTRSGFWLTSSGFWLTSGGFWIVQAVYHPQAGDTGLFPGLGKRADCIICIIFMWHILGSRHSFKHLRTLANLIFPTIQCARYGYGTPWFRDLLAPHPMVHEPGCCRTGIQTHTTVSLAMVRSGHSAVPAPFLFKSRGTASFGWAEALQRPRSAWSLAPGWTCVFSLGLFHSHVRMRMTRRKGPLLLFTCWEPLGQYQLQGGESSSTLGPMSPTDMSSPSSRARLLLGSWQEVVSEESKSLAVPTCVPLTPIIPEFYGWDI